MKRSFNWVWSKKETNHIPKPIMFFKPNDLVFDLDTKKIAKYKDTLQSFFAIHSDIQLATRIQRRFYGQKVRIRPSLKQGQKRHRSKFK